MRIWIDLENTPHALFFPPLVRRLEEAGDTVLLTARDCGQTLELLDLTDLPYQRVGSQGRGPAAMKAASVVARAVRLAGMMRGRDIALSVSHSSRSHVLASRLLGIPVVTLLDYEYASLGVFTRFSDRLMVPETLPLDRLASGATPVVPYPGFKEQLYAVPRDPDPATRERLGVGPETVVVLIRPPATRAHYHEDASDRVFDALLDRLGRETGNVRTVLLPRYPEQARGLARRLSDPPFHVLTDPLPGHSLLSVADLVISGGGTMVREAVAMGIPAVSIFQSRMGGVDEALIRDGRLTHLARPEDVTTLSFVKRPPASGLPNETLIGFLVREIRGPVDEPAGPPA